MVDETGNKDQTRDYYPYGNTRTATGSVSDYQFSRKEKDATGLYYFGKRYYRSEAEIRHLTDDPTIGRWLSVDPMADKYPSLSPYVYCANNPLKYMDMAGDTISISEQMLNNEALDAVLQTEEGRNQIAQFAYERQPITVNGKEYTFDKAGIYSTSNLNFVDVISGDSKVVPINSIGGMDFVSNQLGVQSYDIYIGDNTFGNQMDDIFHEVQHASMLESGSFSGFINSEIVARHHGAMAQGNLWNSHARFIQQANTQFNAGINIDRVWINSLWNTLGSYPKIQTMINNKIRIRY